MCENIIVTILQQTDGAALVEFDRSSASAMVEYDPSRTDPGHTERRFTSGDPLGIAHQTVRGAMGTVQANDRIKAGYSSQG